MQLRWRLLFTFPNSNPILCAFSFRESLVIFSVFPFDKYGATQYPHSANTIEDIQLLVRKYTFDFHSEMTISYLIFNFRGNPATRVTIERHVCQWAHQHTWPDLTSDRHPKSSSLTEGLAWVSPAHHWVGTLCALGVPKGTIPMSHHPWYMC